MKRFEYKVIDNETIQSVLKFDPNSEKKRQEAIAKFEEWLNSHGAKGWQLIGRGYEAQAMVFMREIGTGE